jgi:hypothetical protein
MPNRETIKATYFTNFNLKNTKENDSLFDTLLTSYMIHNKIDNIDTDDFIIVVAQIINSENTPVKVNSGCTLSSKLDSLYTLKHQLADNNCLFHALCYALSLQIDHIELRRIITDHMSQNKAELMKLEWISNYT